MPTDALSHARKIVAGMTAGADLFALCVSAGIEPEDAAGIVLAVACLCALADPATVLLLARALAQVTDGGGGADMEFMWQHRTKEARAAILTILDQAGRDAT